MRPVTKPTATVEGADAIAQIVALQAQRLVRIEATLRRIETMLEQSDPMKPKEGA